MSQPLKWPTLALVAFIATLPSRGLAQPAVPVTPPTRLDHADAPYPASELAHPHDVTVILTVTIGLDGSVSDPEVFESDDPAFNEAAIADVLTWQFSPAQKGGKTVRSRIRIPVHFTPPPATPPPAPVVTPAAPLPAPSPAPTVAAPAPATETPTPAPTNAAAPAPTSLDVDVYGSKQRSTAIAGEYHIKIGALAAVPVTNASDRLKLAPGILLTNEGGEGHAEQVFLRGFDAREGQDIEFTVDGVPINDSGNLHGNGYADTHFIIPELISSLRVVEGPFDPAQGNYAVAGSANYELGLEQRGLTTKISTGSYGTQRLLMTWGPPDMSTGTFAGVEIYKTNGFGSNRSAQRATAMGQYEGRVGDKGSYRITAVAYGTNFQTAGVVREDDVKRVGFYGTEDDNQGGDSSRFSLSGDITNHVGDTDYKLQIFAIRRTMRLRENFTGFLLDTQDPLNELHGQRGDLLDLYYEGNTIGARASSRYTGTLFGLKQTIELGLYARGDQTDSTQYRVEAATNAPYHLDTDLTSSLGDIGLYVDTNIHLLKWLSLRGGVRADLFEFDVLNNCAVQGGIDKPSKTSPPGDASCLDQETNGAHREPVQRSTTGSSAVMPRATFVVGPLRNFTLAMSVGKGVRSIDPIYVSQGYATPFASVVAFDGGITYARLFDNFTLTAKSVAFQTHVDRDLVFDETVGRNTLSNGTTRTGWTGSARATGDFFDEAVNLTLVKSTFDDTGLLVPYVPSAVVRSDTAFFHEMPFHLRKKPVRGVLAAGVSYVGKRALPYGQTSDTIFVCDASASLAWRPLELGITMTNLFNSEYRLGEYNYVSDFHTQPSPTLVPSRAFTAGPPRIVMVSLSGTVGE